MGTIIREIELNNKSTPDKFEMFTSILSEIGQIKNVDYNELLIEGSMKFGLQNVSIKIRFESTESDKVKIHAWSDDVWSYAAKDSIKRILKFLNDPNVKVTEQDKLGMHPILISLLATGFYYLIRFVLMNAESTFREFLALAGVFVIIYMLISKYRFNNK